MFWTLLSSMVWLLSWADGLAVSTTLMPVWAFNPSGSLAVPSSQVSAPAFLEAFSPVISTPKSMAKPLLNLPVGCKAPSNHASENTIRIRLMPTFASLGTLISNCWRPWTFSIVRERLLPRVNKHSPWSGLKSKKSGLKVPSPSRSIQPRPMQ